MAFITIGRLKNWLKVVFFADAYSAERQEGFQFFADFFPAVLIKLRDRIRKIESASSKAREPAERFLFLGRRLVVSLR